MNLIDQRFERSVALHAERPALVAGAARWSYGELGSRARAFAAELQSRGVGAEDRIAIDLGNSAGAIIAIWGSLLSGAAFCCLDPNTPKLRFRAMVEDLRPKALVTRGLRLEADPELRDEFNVFDLDDIESIGIGPLPDPVVDRQPEAMANLVYTSGSTGTAKAIVMSHRSVLAAADAIRAYLGLQANDRILCVLPLSFDYGLYQVLMAHLSGACLVLEPGLGFPGPLLQVLSTEQITVLPGVPTLFELLLRMKGFTAEGLHGLRSFTNTGSALAPQTVGHIRDRFPDAAIFLMYGLSECKRVSYLPPHLVDQHADSVGVPMEGCEVEIVDADAHPLPAGQVGELVVRGANLMSGYWRRPGDTAKRLRPGPWPDQNCLWTGDLFKRDDEGLLYFVGRRDDVFKSGGEKVAPAEVEAALRSHPAIADAAVLPFADALRGTRIVAFIVTTSDRTPTGLKSHCEEQLEPRKRPHEYRRVERLPRNDRGKVDRAQLEQLYHDKSEAFRPENCA